MEQGIHPTSYSYVEIMSLEMAYEPILVPTKNTGLENGQNFANKFFQAIETRLLLFLF